MIIDKNTKNLIKQALREDIGRGDLTTQLLVPSQLMSVAIIVARETGTIAGLDIAKTVFHEMDKNISFKLFVNDGDKVEAGKKIVEIEGNCRAILTAERTALNFLGRLGGIATLTRQFVDKVKPYSVSILDTRKTTPGLRVFEKYAVKCGGGQNHRMGLWDGALIKENHITVHSPQSTVHSEGKKIKKMIEKIREKIPNKMPIEVEVRDLNELKDALSARPDIILLDNMNINQIRKAVSMRDEFLRSPGSRTPNPESRSTLLLEASGGVNIANVVQIARAGVERISIGALTHSARALDLSLLVI